MPYYEYRCLNCREEFGIERAMTAADEAACSKCGGTTVSRIWNAQIVTTGGKSNAGAGKAEVSAANQSSGSCPPSGCGHCR